MPRQSKPPHFAGGQALAIAIGIGAGWYDLSGKLMWPAIPLPDGDRIVVIETHNALTNYGAVAGVQHCAIRNAGRDGRQARATFTTALVRSSVPLDASPSQETTSFLGPNKTPVGLRSVRSRPPSVRL